MRDKLLRILCRLLFDRNVRARGRERTAEYSKHEFRKERLLYLQTRTPIIFTIRNCYSYIDGYESI